MTPLGAYFVGLILGLVLASGFWLELIRRAGRQIQGVQLAHRLSLQSAAEDRKRVSLVVFRLVNVIRGGASPAGREAAIRDAAEYLEDLEQ